MDFTGYLFDFILLTVGPLYTLIGCRKDYKTFLKYEIAGNVIFGILLISKPVLIFTLLVNFSDNLLK